MSVNTAGFYKREVGANRTVLLYGVNLYNKDWNLTVANKDSFTLPHDGWQYYNSIEEACTAYSLDATEWSYYLFNIGDEPV